MGSRDSGLALHEHGAAWLALSKGTMGKHWVVWPPYESPSQVLEGRPATEPVVSWFRGVSSESVSAGMLACLQPPGSVVLLPQGWAHATRNVPFRGTEASNSGFQAIDTVTWAVGRQRHWESEARLNSVEPMMDPVNPALSPPLALLHAGLALKSLSQRQPTITAATAYAEPAVGMLRTAAGLTPPRPSPGLVESAIMWLATLVVGDTPDRPLLPDLPLVRLKALFGLLESRAGASAKGQATSTVHWAGPQGDISTLEAALAAEKQLQMEADLHSAEVLAQESPHVEHGDGVKAQASLLMIAEGLEWLGSWWQSRAVGLASARADADRATPVVEAQIAASRLRAAAWHVAQRAEQGVTKTLLLERLASAKATESTP